LIKGFNSKKAMRATARVRVTNEKRFTHKGNSGLSAFMYKIEAQPNPSKIHKGKNQREYSVESIYFFFR
jgi:hypothetical protein